MGKNIINRRDGFHCCRCGCFCWPTVEATDGALVSVAICDQLSCQALPSDKRCACTGEQSRLPRGPPLPEKSINQNLFISSFIGNVVRPKNYNYISNKLCFSIYLSISISGNLRPKENQPGFCIYNRHMGHSKLWITVAPGHSLSLISRKRTLIERENKALQGNIKWNMATKNRLSAHHRKHKETM